MGNIQKKAMVVLEKFLEIEFPNDVFTEKNKMFLAKYSILKESTKANDILKEINEQITAVDTYWGNLYPKVKSASFKLQNLYSRFNSLCGRDSNAFGGFIGFLEWWYEEVDEHGEHKCFYCEVKESVSKSVFEDKKITSKKFTGGLQIDRKNPDNGYNKENCAFACVLCNNAKSDMISADDYKKYFGEATKKFWEHISNAN